MSESLKIVTTGDTLQQEGVVVIKHNAVTYVDLPHPRIGGKIWVLDAKGIFFLQKGSGVLRTIACTHAGSGAILAYDGIPDDSGFFRFLEGSDEHTRNGREIFRANPAVMGSWMLDGGFYHGLTIIHKGGHMSSAATASIVWMPASGKA